MGTVQKVLDTYGFPRPDLDASENLIGARIRAVYRAHRSDVEAGNVFTFEDGSRYTNRHLVSERTVYLDDSNRYTKTTHSSFDGLGHFRTTVQQSDFTAPATERTTFTGYNPFGGSYLEYHFAPPADPVEIVWATDKPWIIGTLNRTRVTEGQRTVGSTFCFERDVADYPTTGFLRAKRTLLADQNADPTVADTLGEHDSLAVFTRDSEGRVTAEEYLGGALHTGPFPDYCTSATSPVGSEEYRVDHTYTYDEPGQPAGEMLYTASYYRPSQPFTFYIRDLTIDKLSGLVTASRQASGPDTAGLEKLYEYDSMGRIAAEKPVQGAWTAYQYTNATGATPASVDVRVRPNGATTGTTLSAATYLYDPIGRLQTTKRQLADGSWSKQLVEYDGLGRKLKVSEVQAESVADADLKKTLLQYDPFGRVTTTTAPDGSVVTTAYTGARQTARSVSVDGQLSTTTETYDGQGRLASVVEPIAGTDSTTAQYTYDVSGKIATVTQTATGTSTSQLRTFTYDGAGQLTAETMPEVTGSITYGGYDARGHLLSRADAVNTLTFAYDRAERLLSVNETAQSGQRLIKAFTYGAPGDGYTDYGNGKLRQATRYNFYSGLTSSDVTTVKQTNVYNGSFGRVSQRDTEISGTMYAQPRTFTQSFAWTDLGLLDHQDYPRCTTTPCSTTLPARTVYQQYANGALTGVLPYYAQGITYLPNGMPGVLTMPKRVLDVTAGATVTQTVDTGTWMARPATITARDAAEAVAWGGGTYQYDGVGNITAIGTDDYAYDLASRLTGADLTVNGVAKSDDYTYDPFGNLTQVARTDNGAPATRKIAISDATNRFLSTCTPPDGGTCWKGTHDAAGNVTSLQQDANTLTLDYGSSNETRRSVLLGVEHRYAYDTDGERVAVWRSGEGTTFTLRDLSGKVLREVVDDGSGGWRWKEDYVWRDGALLATVSADGGLKHYALDHLGTPRLVTDRCGMTAARHDYFPYGEEATSTTQDAERMKFTGHERDFGGSTSTLDDLDYMHARYYNPAIGRLLAVDPARALPSRQQTWNRYLYAAGNPLLNRDPNGRWAFPAVVAAGVVIGLLMADPAIPPASQVDVDSVPKTSSEGRMISGVMAGVGASQSLSGAAQFVVRTIAGAGRPDESFASASEGAAAGAQASPSDASSAWGRPSTLQDHFERHGSDFGATTPEEYAAKASEFLATSRQQGGMLTKVDDKGVIRVYDPSTNTFGSYNPDGTTRTFYKPDPAKHGHPTNLDYWNAQPGTFSGSP